MNTTITATPDPRGYVRLEETNAPAPPAALAVGTGTALTAAAWAVGYEGTGVALAGDATKGLVLTAVVTSTLIAAAWAAGATALYATPSTDALDAALERLGFSWDEEEGAWALRAPASNP